MEHRLLSYKSSEISYYCFGNGPRPAFCFHGYAEDSLGFRFLEEGAGDQFSFYAIDLPYHGKTVWKEEMDFTVQDLVNIIGKIQNDHTYQANKNNGPLTLMGFSLGGRMALSLYQIIPEQTERIVLMAPDGLKINFWYWLSTQTWAGNKLFAYTMKYPRWFFVFLKMLNKLGFVNASVFKFVRYYIGDPSARTLLYKRWTSLRKLKPSISLIRQLVRNHHTPVRLVYGKHDRIILPVRAEKFRIGIEQFCKISLIDSGHQVLHEKHAQQIIEQLFEV
jgi:pimeloyl-ACP methyl ester carboxylesterase